MYGSEECWALLKSSRVVEAVMTELSDDVVLL